MASFSFGAGNAAKLLRIPFYVLGGVATALIPRSARRWVFGSAVGVADGGLALWNHAVAAGEDTLWLAADAREREQATAAGMRAVERDTMRGFWHTARARVVVITHGFGDVNRYATGGAVIAQLWHGVPLKRLGLDSPATARVPVAALSPLLSPLIRALYRRTQGKISVLPAASHLVRGRLESAFGLSDDRVPVTGEPRVDVLSLGTPDERRTRARAQLESLTGPIGDRPVVLYAPTWRDGASDPAIPDAEDWDRIHEMLAANDAVLALRSHPLGAGDYRAGLRENVRMLGSDILADVTGVLPGCDVLVTDYSSLVFDASLVPVPTVFFAPDAEAYAAERGFYGRYDDVTEGTQARTWAEASAQIGAVLGDHEERERRMMRATGLDAVIHAHRDGRNTERVYRVISQRVERSGR